MTSWQISPPGILIITSNSNRGCVIFISLSAKLDTAPTGKEPQYADPCAHNHSQDQHDRKTPLDCILKTVTHSRAPFSVQAYFLFVFASWPRTRQSGAACS